MGKHFKGLICKIIMVIMLFSSVMQSYSVRAKELPKSSNSFYSIFMKAQAVARTHQETIINQKQSPLPLAVSMQGKESSKVIQPNNTKLILDENPSVNIIKPNLVESPGINPSNTNFEENLMVNLSEGNTKVIPYVEENQANPSNEYLYDMQALKEGSSLNNDEYSKDNHALKEEMLLNNNEYLKDIQDKNVGRLFYKNDGTISTFSILDGIDVTVDKEIVEMLKPTTLTITVMQNGSPLVNENVTIVGYTSGTTNAEGKFITTITPQKSSSIPIKVKESYYQDLIFSISSTQAVLEITAKDRQGNFLSAFKTTALSSNFIFSDSTVNSVKRKIVEQGQYQVVVSNQGNEIYYMQGNINVLPLTLSKITLDGETTVPASFMFSYQGIALNTGTVYLQSADITDIPYKYIYNKPLGLINQTGNYSCFVTPGNYNIYVDGRNNENEHFYLSSKNQILSGTPEIKTINWDKNNTGLLKFNLTGSIPEWTAGKFVFEEFEVYFQNQESIRFNLEDTKLTKILIEYNTTNGYALYEYTKSFFQSEIISILPNQTYNYDLNVNIKECKITSSPALVPPNSNTKISLDLITQSDHLLYSLYSPYSSIDYRKITYLVEKPDKTTISLTSTDYKFLFYNVPNDAQLGDYIFSSTKDFGPLYGLQAATGKLTILPNPDVNVDKVVINYNQENTVTFTATMGDVPLAGAIISLDIPNIQGVTDASGKFTTTFTPNRRGEIVIFLNGKYFRDKLFSVSPNEGVVEISATDKNNALLNNFFYCAFTQKTISSNKTSGTIGRLFAVEGENSILVTSNGLEGYYILKKTTVLPGQINKITLDGASTIPIEMSYQYNSIPIQYAQLSIENSDFYPVTEDRFMLQPVGSLNKVGEIIVNVTPGTYSLQVEGINSNRENLFFYRDNIVLNTSQAKIINNWDEIDTGVINFNTTISSLNASVTRIQLNNHSVKFNPNSTLRINKGQYTNKYISLSGIFSSSSTNGLLSNFYYINYKYARSGSKPEIIVISPNTPINYDFDMTLKEVSIVTSPHVVKPGENIGIEIKAITNSNHEVTSFGFYEPVYYKITDPNNSSKDLKGSFNWSNYYIDESSPAGTYKIETQVNLGNLYPPQQASGQFEVAREVNIMLDKNCIRIGATEDITITVMENGVPLGGKTVSISSITGNFDEGITDANGQVVLTVTPQNNNPLYIYVDGIMFWDQLFALDENSGVIEVTASDLYGNPMDQFIVDAYGSVYKSFAPGMNSVARIIQSSGEVALLLTKGGDAPSYYIFEKINVVPGIVNKVQLSAANFAIAKLKFDFKGAPIQNSQINIQKLNTLYPLKMHELGVTDGSGEKILYITPGTYNLNIISGQSNEEAFYLKVEDTLIESGNNIYNYSWDELNTGLIQFNTQGFENSLSTVGVVFGNDYISLPQSNTMRMGTGTYNLSNLYITTNANNVTKAYDFSWPSLEKYEINAISNGTSTYNIDLNLKELTFKLNKNIYLPGEKVNSYVKVLTNSGFELINVQDAQGVEVTVENPNGDKDTFANYDYSTMTYYLPSDAVPGLYKMYLTLNLGSNYGTHELYTEFSVGAYEAFKVLNTTPNNAQQRVAINSNIVTEFNRNEIFEQTKFGEITVKDVKGNEIPRALKIEQNKIIITPSAPLGYGTLYYVTIPSQAVADLNGNLLEGDYLFSFITEEEAVPFILQVTNPQNSETNVQVSKKLLLTFSEEILQGTNFNGIELKTVDGTKIDINIGIENRTIVITPQYALAYATGYVLVIPENAVANLSATMGNVPATISFTTETDSEAPIIITSSPDNNSNEAMINGEILITFNEEITSVVNTYQVGNKKGGKTATLELRDSIGNIVTVKTVIEGKVMRIIPLNPLSFGTQYTLVIPINFISDLKGNRNLNEYILNFTTQK